MSKFTVIYIGYDEDLFLIQVEAADVSGAIAQAEHDQGLEEGSILTGEYRVIVGHHEELMSSAPF